MVNIGSDHLTVTLFGHPRPGSPQVDEALGDNRGKISCQICHIGDSQRDHSLPRMTLPPEKCAGIMEIVDTISSILNYTKSKEVWTSAPDITVCEAIRFMSEKNIGALPIVRDATLVGIVSERDYTRKVILKGRSSRETPVEDIMTGEVVTVQPSM